MFRIVTSCISTLPTTLSFFDLAPNDARQQVSEMAKTISNNWKQALRTEGASPGGIRYYADAFEHEEMERALKL
jgi:serine/threonine-protein kinase HipA